MPTDSDPRRRAHGDPYLRWLTPEEMHVVNELTKGMLEWHARRLLAVVRAPYDAVARRVGRTGPPQRHERDPERPAADADDRARTDREIADALGAADRTEAAAGAVDEQIV